MDLQTYKELLRLVGKIAVQYNLPSGDPCWISKKICSYVGSHLDDTIIKYRHVRKNHKKLVEEWKLIIKEYCLLKAEDYSKQRKISLIAHKLSTYKPESNRLYKIISSYHTPDTRIDIDRRCYN